MTQPSILGIGTAIPDNHYEQMEICANLSSAFDNSHRAPAVFRASDVETRHSVVENLNWLVANPSNSDRLRAYMTHALPLGVKAIEQTLNQVQLAPTEIDDFIVVSCTGVDTPGLDIKIAEAMGMSPYLRRATLVGMGCQALIPALYQAANILQGQPESRVLVLTLELCTLHFQHGRTLKNMLGSALFADGASAVVIGNGSNQGLCLLDTLTYSDYQTQEELSFHPGDTGYQIHLSARIPNLLGTHVPHVVARILSRHKLQLSDITHWMVHPGGMKILDCVEEALGLPKNALQHSRAILRQYGNMSSATLLFVLERVMDQAQPLTNDYGILIGFGPGLTIEVGLIQW
jgi:predicted naringenin-chalcone synthase